MRYLLIDTCSWIDVAKDHPDLLPRLVDLVEEGQVTLLLPKVVIREWNKHKVKKVHTELLDTFDGQVTGVRTLQKHLGPLLPEGKVAEWREIHVLLQQQRRRFQARVQDRIDRIEGLFNHPQTIILPISDEAKLQAAGLALVKKAPFGDRNSMADALIFLTVLQYAVSEGIEEFLFVSSNTDDYAQDFQLHPDLVELSGNVKVRYFANIGRGINEIEEGLLAEERIQEIELSLAIGDLSRQRRRFLNALLEASSTASVELPILSAYHSASQDLLEGINASAAIAEAVRASQEGMREYLETVRKASEASRQSLARQNAAVAEAVRASQEGMRKYLEVVQKASEASKQSLAWQSAAVAEAVRASQEGMRQYLEATLKASEAANELLASGKSPVAQAVQAIQQDFDTAGQVSEESLDTSSERSKGDSGDTKRDSAEDVQQPDA